MRRQLILLLWMCDICLYMARTNVSVAIGKMFTNDSLEGELLSAFYWGYAIFQVPAGWLAARVGAKRVLGTAVIVWSIASMLCALIGKNVPVLFALRVITGMAESCSYPSMAQLVSVWVPYEERGTAWALITSGESIGTILMLLLGPFLVNSYGWPSVFWVSGATGLCWTLLFVVLATADPSNHPFISTAERVHITASRPPPLPIITTPWRAIFSNRPFLATVATHVFYNWTFYIGLSWIDKFLKSSYHPSTEALALSSIVPYIALFFCGSASGVVADALEQQLRLSPTTARKLVNTSGFAGGAAGFFALSFVAPVGGSSPRGSLAVATLCLSVAIGLGGFGASAGYMRPSDAFIPLQPRPSLPSPCLSHPWMPCVRYWANFADLSPRHGQILLSISNSIASVPGIIGNNLTGKLLSSTHDNWALIFRISAGSLLLGVFPFALFSSSVDQRFDETQAGALAAKLLVLDDEDRGGEVGEGGLVPE